MEGLLTAPYVTLPEFKAAPTWLDVDDLIPGGVGSQQDEELYNVLLRASGWADDWCGQRLGAHTAYEQARTRVNRNGLVYLHPSNVPVRQVTGIAYGADFQNLTALTDLSQIWVEDARGIVVSMLPLRGTWAGSLEFGAIPASSQVQLFVAFQYTAGYGCTVLSEDVDADATSLPVYDPAGFQPPSTTAIGTLAGSTVRLWDPGFQEAVQISSSYTAGDTPLLTTSGVRYSHSAGAGISEMPPEIHQAVIAMAVSLMMREDVSDDEPFAGAPYGPALRRSAAGGKAGGLLDNAYELLEPYRRVR